MKEFLLVIDISTLWIFNLSGSKLIWSELFDILKHFIEPSGYEYLRELLGGVVNYETAINQSIQSLRDLAPHLKNEENSARVNFLADECENLLNKLKSKGTSLKDISEFAKKSVAKLKDEL